MKGYYYIFLACILFYACANPVAPSGGDKDIEAPKVILQQPANGSANYQGDVIEIWFDEFITFSASEQNVLITPNMPERPQFQVKGKKLLIKLPENLDTTVSYSITFIDAIKDYTEGNTVNALKYVFTKGAAIDSASVSGRVIDAQYNASVEGVFVGLYPVTDTAVLSQSKPMYIAPADKQGNFTLDYVKEGSYILAAIQDKNLNYIFDQNSEKISLPSVPINVVGSMSLEEEVKLFQNETAPSVEGYKVLNNNELYFYFSQEIEELDLDIIPYNDADLAYFNKGNDTLFYHWNSIDSSQIKFYFGLNKIVKDTVLVTLKKIEDNPKFAVKDDMHRNHSLRVEAPKPISLVNADRVILKDSLKQLLSAEIIFEKKDLFVKIPGLKEGQIYLELDSGAIQYYDGTWNTNRFMKFVDVLESQENSKLVLLFDKTALPNTYLEVLDKNNIRLESYDIAGLSKLNINTLKPGTYTLKIYDDQNQNGKWTTGNFEQGRPPEKVYLISQSIELKPNWDKELNLNF